MIALILLATIMGALGLPATFHDPMVNEGLFEGDIMGRDPYDRNAMPKDSQIWPQGIVPYYINASLDYYRSEIIRAFRHIENSTCVRFVEKSPEHIHYISFFRGNGCWSHLGFVNKGKQDLSLGNLCDYFGTVIHEVFHALGFEHEHNRSDRDSFVIVNWDNMQEQWYSAFRKLRPEENRLLTTFDYDSIMMYGHAESFSKDGRSKCMESVDRRRYLQAAWQKSGMSPSDIIKVNKLYNCENKPKV